MFIIMLTYTKPLTVVDQYVVAHREYLEEGYQKDYFIASGPLIPRTGGILLSQLKDREKLMEIIRNDPFKLNDVADYEVLEFDPVKHHVKFKDFVK